MNSKEINREYIENILNNKEKYLRDYEKIDLQVRDSKAYYKGKPVPYLYNPYLVVEEDLEAFQKIGDMILEINDLISKRFLEDKEFRKKFRYPEWLNELIEIENGYDINVPIGRFDIFYGDSNDFKFCEINTDGSSAMNEDNELAKILIGAESIRDLEGKYSFSYFDLFTSWVDESLEIYKGYCKKKGLEANRPNIAIVDFKESATSIEFEVFKEAYIRRGYKCIIVDPRDLKYLDGKLYFEDYKIDLVYRRMVTYEILEKKHEIKDFLEAYRKGAFCCIGSIRSQIPHNKIFFKVLHDEDTLEFLSEGQRNFIKNHIPYTGILEGEEAFKRVLVNKDKYILKPIDKNASQGVFAGRDFDKDIFEKKLREALGNDYLYQEFYEAHERSFLVKENGDFQVKEIKMMQGLFLYKGKLAGLYLRIGNKSIISGLSEYYSLPTILVKEKHPNK